MSSPLLETFWIDTAIVPATQRFATWAAHGAASRYLPLQGDDFFAQGAYWNLGPAVVTCARVDPFVSERDTARIAEQPFDHMQIVALIEGVVTMRTTTTTFECAAPSVFACDYAQTYRIETGRTRIASVYFSRGFLEEVTGPLRCHGPLRQSAEGAFFAANLTALGDVMPFIAAGSARHYARMLRDLAAAAIGEEERQRGNSADQRQRMRIEAAIAAIPPGEIDVAALCRSERINRTSLYRLFRSDGGVLAWDRRRRLQAFFRAITDPAEHRSLSEIGAAHGFFDGTNLSRAFRSCFGMTPSDARRLAVEGVQRATDARSAFDRLRSSVVALSSRPMATTNASPGHVE
jgi:AraC-like DNA-binding protein